MMKHFLSFLFAFVAFLFCAQATFAQASVGGTIPGGFPQDTPTNIDANADIIVYPNHPSAGNYPNNRLLSPSARFILTDNGAGGTLQLELATVTAAYGGTGLTATPTNGQLLIGNGSGYTLATLTAGTNVTISNSAGGITINSTGSGAPASATFITQANESATLTNSRQLQGTAGDITLTDGGAGSTMTLDIGNSVVTLTGTQTLTNKTLTSAKFNTQLTLNNGSNATITWAAFGQATAIQFPDPGTVSTAHVCLDQGNDTIAGTWTFSNAPKLSTNTITTSTNNTVTIPNSTDTLVNLGSAQSITGQKTITSPILNTNVQLQTTNNYTLTWAANSSGSLTYTIPNTGVNGQFVMSDGSMSYAAGKIPWCDGSAIGTTAAGSTGQAFISAGTSVPTWGVLGTGGGGTNNGSLSVTAGTVYYGDGTKLLGLAPTTNNGWVLSYNTGTNSPAWAAPGSGVTSFSAGNLSPLFTTSVATATTTPALTFSLTNAGAGTIFGNWGTSSGAPSFNAIGSTQQVPTVTSSGGVSWATPGDFAAIAGGRLTISSSSPYPQNTTGTTLYYYPLNHTKIALYNGTSVIIDDIGTSGISVAVPNTTATTYDVYVSDSGGTPGLHTVAWTNATTPPTRGVSNGIPYTNNNTQDRWVGTIYTDPSVSGQLDDQNGFRGIWNYSNQLPMSVWAQINVSSWTYGTQTLRASDSNTSYGAGRIGIVCGATGGSVNLTFVQSLADSSSSSSNGIGMDSTSAIASNSTTAISANEILTVSCSLSATAIAAGFHYYQMLEWANNTVTFYGSGATSAGGFTTSPIQSALQGTVCQ